MPLVIPMTGGENGRTVIVRIARTCVCPMALWALGSPLIQIIIVVVIARFPVLMTGCIKQHTSNCFVVTIVNMRAGRLFHGRRYGHRSDIRGDPASWSIQRRPSRIHRGDRQRRHLYRSRLAAEPAAQLLPSAAGAQRSLRAPQFPLLVFRIFMRGS